MKNQYVGDIGDYGKYGLLRFLEKNGMKIGINWYLTNNDESSDGKYTDYLKKDINNSTEYCCDPELFSTLKDISFLSDGSPRKSKSVHMVEDADLIPKTVYYHNVLNSKNLDSSCREETRQSWFNGSLLAFKDSDLVFADPDNGITFRKTARFKDSEKYILPEEVKTYYDMGKDVVYYCHKGRRTQDKWEKVKRGICDYINDAQILVITFHKGTQRSYIFVVHPENYHKYDELLKRFLITEWNTMFTAESINHGS